MYLTTFTGKLVDPANLRASEISIVDIAHSLSNQCRFGGHCSTFYSVAQHSIRVAEHLDHHQQLVGLLHDATEAYLMDLPRPLKLILPGYAEQEKKVWEAIAEAFKINVQIPPEVVQADNMALRAEWQELMNAPLPDALRRYPALLPDQTMSPAESKAEFLRLYYELTDQL